MMQKGQRQNITVALAQYIIHVWGQPYHFTGEQVITLTWSKEISCYFFLEGQTRGERS